MLYMEMVTPVCEYPTWLKEIHHPKLLIVQIKLNENPMYFDDEGNRNLEEPMYQIVIRITDPQTNTPKLSIYDYFDSPTLLEAHSFVQLISKDIQSLGFQDVQLSPLDSCKE